MPSVNDRLSEIEGNQIKSDERQAVADERIIALHLCKQEFVDILGELNPKMVSFSAAIDSDKKERLAMYAGMKTIADKMDSLSSEMSDFIEWKKRGTLIYRMLKRISVFVLNSVIRLKKLIVWIGAFSAL